MESKTAWTTGPQGERIEHGTITHEGREFTNLGAAVSSEWLVCYPDNFGNVRDWSGKWLGTYRTISSRDAIWFGRSSCWGTRYYFMRATVDGREYSIRGFGPGMIAKGKAIKRA